MDVDVFGSTRVWNKNNIVYQDNQSAIKMEQNGRDSTTGKSRHINIRYFFVKDRIAKGGNKVEYCPTGLMLADYFTKALYGKQLVELREYIMGWRDITDLMTPSTNKEHVGRWTITREDRLTDEV